MPDIRFDDYSAIIPHPTDACILLLKSEDGWTLPQATVPPWDILTAQQNLLDCVRSLLELMYRE